MSAVTLTVKCVSCGATRVVRPGEIAEDDFPMCDRDGMPMMPHRADAAEDA